MLAGRLPEPFRELGLARGPSLAYLRSSGLARENRDGQAWIYLGPTDASKRRPSRASHGRRSATPRARVARARVGRCGAKEMQSGWIELTTEEWNVYFRLSRFSWSVTGFVLLLVLATILATPLRLSGSRIPINVMVLALSAAVFLFYVHIRKDPFIIILSKGFASLFALPISTRCSAMSPRFGVRHFRWSTPASPEPTCFSG